jgi:hypothetical protein
VVALLVKTGVREARPLDAAKSGASNGENAPLQPSRYRLNQVTLLHFPGEAHADNPPQVVSNVKHTLGSRIELRPMTISARDLDDHSLQAAFGVRRLPALVIAGQWTTSLESARSPGFEAPAYCAIDDEDLLQDIERLTRQAENLVKIFAAASVQEIQNVLRTRRFRVLVWKAESRSGDTIDYITNLTARFGLGHKSLLLAFDDSGWTTEVEPGQSAVSIVFDPASELLADPSVDGLDTWADDGGAWFPPVDAEPRDCVAVRATGKRPRRSRVVGQPAESAHV